MFYSSLVPVLGNLPVLFIGDLPPLETLAWLPGLLVLGPIGVYAGIAAVRHANAAMLGPYTLLRLVIAFAGAIIIFRELPDLFSSLGAVLIVASCLLASGVSGSNPFIRLRGAKNICRAGLLRLAGIVTLTS
jgi:drug/metabolite transporter (DMT)-like permease